MGVLEVRPAEHRAPSARRVREREAHEQGECHVALSAKLLVKPAKLGGVSPLGGERVRKPGTYVRKPGAGEVG
jgi:hypothetical protein